MLLNEVGDKIASLSEEEKNKKHFGITLLELFKTSFGRETKRKLTSPEHSLSDIPDGILMRKWLHYSPAEADDLVDTLSNLESSPATAKHKVRFIVAYDGESILTKDTKLGDTLTCTLTELAEKATFFAPLYGQERFIAAEESEIDRQATTQLGRIYDALVKANPEWAQNHTHDLNTFMTRLLFCLFAEDTGIFEKNLLTKAITECAGNHGEHMHEVIGDIFRTLNTPEDKRQNEPAWLAPFKFPYVNGDVFDIDDIEVPRFSPTAYRYFMTASSIDWAHVHADILGSSIQKIVDAKTRGELGMHYTSVSNIKKVIDPLFMDELRERLATIKGYKNPASELHKLLDRISAIKVFDPACGSGNFLVIAYQSLRELEIDILNALSECGEKQVSAFSRITLDNFYGIEYAEFAAETAKIALRIVEYQMDERYRAEFGAQGVTLPLRESPNIVTDSALNVCWRRVCPPSDDVFLCGNPPYLGFGYRSESQNAEHKKVVGRHISSYKQLDYVCNWFILAAEYIATHSNARVAFVSTNSINQGIHTQRFWPAIYKMDCKIHFAWRSFKWSNMAGNNAGVSCSIIGMCHKSKVQKSIIYEKDTKAEVQQINPDLSVDKRVPVSASPQPISNLPRMILGSCPTDGGHLHLSEEKRVELIQDNPDFSRFILKVVGSSEMMRGEHKLALWFDNAEDAHKASSNILIKSMIAGVREFREESKKKSTQEKAATPFFFAERRHFSSDQRIVIPLTSSENRNFLPVGVYFDDIVVNNNAYAIESGDLFTFSVLSSKLMRLWQETNGGRLEDRLRYSNTMVWNTFPMPTLNDDQKTALNKTARDILRAREEYGSHLTLGDMYMPDKMPDELKAAHNKNDAVIERIFNPKGFRNDEERLAHLFARYAEMTKDKE